MREFYRDRLSKHQTKLMRYLKYVFNDHIVLVSTFLIGGFGFYYADFVKTLSPNFFIGKPFVILIWFLVLLSGKFATLIKEADQLFLLPKEKQLHDYLKQAFKHSLVLPFTSLLLTTGVLMPLLIAVNRSTVVDFILYCLILWLLKTSHMMRLLQHAFQIDVSQLKRSLIIWGFVSLSALTMTLYVSPLVGLALALVLTAYDQLVEKKKLHTASLHWQRLVELEQQRMKTIYQFINLFTDVPGMTGKVKRRRIFDPILKRIARTHTNTYRYLYARSFIRGAEYSGLVFRLTVVAVLIIASLKEWPLILGISLLSLFLIGFQLIPLFNQFNYMTMTQLYPLTPQMKNQDFKNLVTKILSIVTVIIGITLIIFYPDKKLVGLIILALIVEILVFHFIYLPKRLQKMTRF
ncbi:ABC transporter permease [Vagococcus fessus]|uniref:Multidrug ABC transporter permease n=1 Tax=Vagococcus fessus TaxID=120370 RepID=A0A430A882_9ENTE|nr:ABC transporter permease [Vagococcus fessus]RSU03312.1 hypothetical protein CBF31_06245 [Vagococcus fessus]